MGALELPSWGRIPELSYRLWCWSYLRDTNTEIHQWNTKSRSEDALKLDLIYLIPRGGIVLTSWAVIHVTDHGGYKPPWLPQQSICLHECRWCIQYSDPNIYGAILFSLRIFLVSRKKRKAVNLNTTYTLVNLDWDDQSPLGISTVEPETGAGSWSQFPVLAVNLAHIDSVPHFSWNNSLIIIVTS